MTARSNSTTSAHRLVKLSDTDLTLADGELDVRSMPVTDAQGNDVGDVADLYIDRSEGHVRFLSVKHGDFLGLGGTTTLIPVEAIRRIDDHVQLGYPRQMVAGAPRYDPDLATEPRWEDYYGYYGYPPYWVSGYAGYPPGIVTPP